MRAEEATISVRTSSAAYAVLWTPLGILLGLSAYLLLRGHTELAWLMLGLLLVGTGSSLNLAVSRLALGGDALEYRSLLQRIVVPRPELARVRVETNHLRVLRQGAANELRMPTKHLARNGLKRLIRALVTEGTHVEISEAAAYVLFGADSR